MSTRVTEIIKYLLDRQYLDFPMIFDPIHRSNIKGTINRIDGIKIFLCGKSEVLDSPHLEIFNLPKQEQFELINSQLEYVNTCIIL